MKKLMKFMAWAVAVYLVIALCFVPLMGVSAIAWPMMILAIIAMAKYG